jgi:hypothetical protein
MTKARCQARDQRSQGKSARASLVPLLALLISADLQAATPDEGAAWGVDPGPLLIIPPALGLRVGGSNAKLTFALPWSIQFGPLLGDHWGEYGVRPYRAVLELGLAQSRGEIPADQHRTAYYFRGGLRRVWSSGGLWGFGAGAGFTQSLSTNISSALSPEALLVLGHCCDPGFLIVSARYEYSFSAPGELWITAGLGLW